MNNEEFSVDPPGVSLVQPNINRTKRDFQETPAPDIVLNNAVTPTGISPAPNGRNQTNNLTNKDRNRDLSTAKTAQSTPQNTNPNANRTIGHYLVGKYTFIFSEGFSLLRKVLSN
jgi:hypothetical protein